MSVQDIYHTSIKSLPAVDRLRLAKMILNDIPVESLFDFSDSWTDEDLADFTKAGWRNADEFEIDNAESR
jgi:hypothetical protein